MNKIMLAVIGLLIVGGSFWAGMKYQESQRTTQFRMFAGQGERNGQLNGRTAGFRPVSGEILSAEEKSLIVKLSDGSSKLVFMSDSTGINKSTEGAKEDLKAGEKVMVIGTENSDGSITAQNVQINPARGI